MSHESTVIDILQCRMPLQDPAQVPAWLNVTKTLIPDFVVANPKVCQSSFCLTVIECRFSWRRMSRNKFCACPHAVTDCMKYRVGLSVTSTLKTSCKLLKGSIFFAPVLFVNLFLLLSVWSKNKRWIVWFYYYYCSCYQCHYCLIWYMLKCHCSSLLKMEIRLNIYEIKLIT